jgi:hypothetical protein
MGLKSSIPVGGHRHQGGKILRIFGILILLSTAVNIILFGVLQYQPAASLVSNQIRTIRVWLAR